MTPFSFSRISAWWRCPLAYKFQYIDGLPRSSGLAAEVGSINHKMFENYARHCIKEGLPTDLDKGRALIERAAIGLDPFSADDVRFVCHKFLETHTFPRPARIEVPVGLRYRPRLKRWDKALFNGPRTMYRGVMDYLEARPEDGYVLILDYKTGRILPDRNHIRNDPQLKGYAFMASVLYPDIDLFICVLDYVRYNLRFDPVEIDRIEAEEYGQILAETIKEVNKAESFPAKYLGARCDWCDYLHNCPEYKRAMRETDIPNVELDEISAARLAAHMGMLKAGATRIESRLKNFVEKNGRIMLEGRDLDFRPVIKRRFPNSRGVTEELLRLGVERDDVWEKLRISFKDLENLAKAYELSEGDLSTIMSLCETTTDTQFRFKKIDDKAGRGHG